MGRDNHLRDDILVYVGAVSIAIGAVVLLSNIIGLAR